MAVKFTRYDYDWLKYPFWPQSKFSLLDRYRDQYTFCFRPEKVANKKFKIIWLISGHIFVKSGLFLGLFLQHLTVKFKT